MAQKMRGEISKSIISVSENFY